MDQILLCTNHIPRTTLISNTFIEHYMPEANGDYVKVYLYLAKCIQYQEAGLSISSLADRMDNTEKDVIRALQYWEKRNLLQLDRDPHTNMITGIHMLSEQPASHSHDETIVSKKPTEFMDSTETAHTDLHNTPADSQMAFTHNTGAAQTESHSNPADSQMAFIHSTGAAQTDAETAAASAVSTSASDTSSTQTAPQTGSKVVPITGNSREISVPSAMMQELASNEEFIWTCHVIESYLDRPMKPNETRLISYLYGTLHFSKDLLLYLYEYCISLGKTNNNYIQAVALSWDEQGVTTPEEAEKVSTAYNSAYNAVSKSLALGRALATVEKKCVDHWQHNWHMDLSVILEACNRTILKVHKADFKYIEGILDRWQKNGVHTLQDVEQADLAYAQNKENHNKTSKSQPQGQSKNQFQNFQQRNASSQEVDDLERKLLTR